MSHTIGRARKARKPPVEMELQLRGWAQRGSAAADVDGKTLLIDRGIPGERIEALVDRRRRPWRGVVERVFEPSPDRITPACRYYTEGCGGCQWQHLRYGAQLETKRQLADRELERAGARARVQAIHGMDEPWRYRRTAAIAIGWEAGFRPRARRGILEIHDCPISHPLIGHLADRLNVLLRKGHLPNYHGKVWLDCTVTGNAEEPGLQVVVQGIEGLTLEGHPELPEVARTVSEVEGVESVAFRHRSGDVRPLAGELMSKIEVAGRAMYTPAGSFVQTNLRMVPRVLERMSSELRGQDIRHAADIYGGVGTFGLPLAALVERMTLIELDPAAVEAARRTAQEWGLTNVDFVSRHAERALGDLSDLDLAIVDPPRSGLGPAVTGALIEHQTKEIFYVSCSPPSLADDLAALESGDYTACSLDLFDFYPQTYHVEALAILRR
jgi:23S rRNA (uracil1939-C5)-methyltransferase